MIIVWGKIVGLGLGSFGGVLGAAFGGLVGHLVDMVAADYLLRRAMSAFFRGARRSGQFYPPAAIAAGLVAYCVHQGWSPQSHQRETFCNQLRTEFRTTRRIRQALWLSIAERGLRRYLDAAMILHGLPSEATLVDIALRYYEDPRDLVETCVAVLGTDLRGPASERLRRIAEAMEIEQTWIDRVVPDRDPKPLIAAEDCAVLGIEADARLADVKQVYRSLAAQFHPDTLAGLSEEQRIQSADAFVRIRAAYERVVAQIEEREASRSPD